LGESSFLLPWADKSLIIIGILECASYEYFDALLHCRAI